MQSLLPTRASSTQSCRTASNLPAPLYRNHPVSRPSSSRRSSGCRPVRKLTVVARSRSALPLCTGPLLTCVHAVALPNASCRIPKYGHDPARALVLRWQQPHSLHAMCRSTCALKPTCTPKALGQSLRVSGAPVARQPARSLSQPKVFAAAFRRGNKLIVCATLVRRPLLASQQCFTNALRSASPTPVCRAHVAVHGPA
jgi:hypothetical protein